MRTAADAMTRRALLKGASAGTLVVAFHLPVAAANAVANGKVDTGREFAPNAFVRIGRDGTTSLVMPQVEMGQGIYTAVAMILAEELDADFARVAVMHAPPDEKLYVNPLMGVQATGSSTSVRAFWQALRSAGASARALLVQAAAARWKVGAAECTTAAGQVVHTASGRKLGYGELAEAAALLPAVKDAPLKDPSRFTLIGKPLKRLDTPGKVNGSAMFGIDTRLPGMKFATIAASPVLGGKVRRVDDSAAKDVAGVRKVVVLDDLVAVVGDHMWAAKKGLEALKIEWNEGPNARVSSQQMWDELRLAGRKDGVVAASAGDVGRKPAPGAVRIEAAYELPLLAHAALEPMNCTVHLQRERCELWLGTQVIARVQQEVAGLLKLPLEKVTVHNHLIGGGFGRRLEADMALSAVRVAQQVDGVPLKVVWTREEDTRHDLYRPMYRDLVSGTLDKGTLSSLDFKVCGSAVMARWLPAIFEKGILDAVEGAVHLPYDIPNFRVRYVRAEPKAVRTGFWRGVAANNNVFAIECFLDEAARKAGKDPVAFRAGMLGKTPRLKAALELAAAKSGWGQPAAKRVGRGVCAQTAFESFIATVVETEVDTQGEVHIRRVTCAVDTGIVVNPDTVVAQLEGGLVFGLGAALYGDISVKNGRVEQSNFHDYRVLRMNEIPKIEVHLVKSGELPGGIGETGTVAAAPALRNAIYAATGVALRTLPIDRKALSIARKA